jgi:hypothetical protein
MNMTTTSNFRGLRNLGALLQSLGHDRSRHSLLGEHHDNPMENDFLKKILAGRQ